MPSAKDLVLRLRSVTTGFTTDSPVRELDDLEEALRDSSTEAARSAREVKKAADDMDAPGFDRAAAEAESTARRMRDAGDDMADGIADGAREVDRQTDQMRRDLGEAGRESGSEFISNIAEGIGSGSGDLNDVISGTLGGLTNLAGTLMGPVGIAAGAAAAGIGVVWNTMQRQAEETQARVDGIVTALEEVEDQSTAAADAKIFEVWLEQMKQMPDELQAMVGVMQDAGVEADVFRAAIAGSEDAQDQVREAVQKTGGDIIKNQKETGNLTDAQQIYLDNMGIVLDQLSTQNDDLTAAKDLHEDINWLQGETPDKQDKTTEAIKRSREEAQGLKKDLDDATKDRSVNVKINTTETKKSKWIDLDDPRGGTQRGSGYGYN